MESVPTDALRYMHRFLNHQALRHLSMLSRRLHYIFGSRSYVWVERFKVYSDNPVNQQMLLPDFDKTQQRFFACQLDWNTYHQRYLDAATEHFRAVHLAVRADVRFDMRWGLHIDKYSTTDIMCAALWLLPQRDVTVAELILLYPQHAAIFNSCVYGTIRGHETRTIAPLDWGVFGLERIARAIQCRQNRDVTGFMFYAEHINNFTMLAEAVMTYPKLTAAIYHFVIPTLWQEWFTLELKHTMTYNTMYAKHIYKYIGLMLHTNSRCIAVETLITHLERFYRIVPTKIRPDILEYVVELTQIVYNMPYRAAVQNYFQSYIPLHEYALAITRFAYRDSKCKVTGKNMVRDVVDIAFFEEVLPPIRAVGPPLRM